VHYRKKPVVIEAFTFSEFVDIGKICAQSLVNGMPWSFQFRGRPITHETDTCYLIPTIEGTMKFTPDAMLIVGVKGEIYLCKLDIFMVTYERL